MANFLQNYVLNEPCKYFNSATGCWFGDHCKFQHVEQTVPCRFFLSKGCKYGDNCRFSHERPTVPPVPLYYRPPPPLPIHTQLQAPPPGPPVAIFSNYFNGQADPLLQPPANSCGQCGFVVKEEKDKKIIFSQLTAHYVESFSSFDPAHMAFFKEELDLANRQTSCSVCMKRFDNVTYLFKHFRTMTRNKKDVAHKTIFEIVARPFVERDMFHETDPEVLLDNIKMIILDPCCLSSDSESEIETLTIRMGQLHVPTVNIEKAFEKEMRETINQCGYANDDVEEFYYNSSHPLNHDCWDSHLLYNY